MKIPSDTERDLRLPGPGAWLRDRWGWKPLLHTLTSGIWVLPGALVSRGFGEVLEAAAAHGSAAAHTALHGRYAPIQVANARTRTGKAQLSGHILEGGVSAFSLVCGGLSHP